jgi:hypothetical protein
MHAWRILHLRALACIKHATLASNHHTFSKEKVYRTQGVLRPAALDSKRRLSIKPRMDSLRLSESLNTRPLAHLPH